MADLITRGIQNIGGRTGGPLALRFLLQPCVAAFIALCAGRRDRAAERRPYLQALVKDAPNRRGLVREALRDLWRLCVMALAFDTLYQVYVLHWFYPGEALIVTFLLAVAPYTLVRDTVCRLIRRGGANEVLHMRADGCRHAGAGGRSHDEVRRRDDNR